MKIEIWAASINSGLSYFWDILTDAASEEIADRAVTQVSDYILFDLLFR
jgi:hypothetical protein